VTRVLLLPSPLLPRLSHLPFLQALGARLRAEQRVECAVDVAMLPRSPADAQVVLAAFRESVSAGSPDLVLTHSNAGRFAALAAPGIPVVHVDAALPPEHGDASMAPQGLLDHLADLADEHGVLPPWTRWWPDDDLALAMPDAQTLAEIRAEEQRMPLAYFRSRLGAPSGWVDRPQAYLAFGNTYAEETAFALRHGWPTTVLDGTLHLHHLVDPDAVADAVLGLAARLGVARGAQPGAGPG
jgi:hypothetical protein